MRSTDDVRLDDAPAAGILFKRGKRVVLILKAANRDGDAFPASHELRQTGSPTRIPPSRARP